MLYVTCVDPLAIIQERMDELQKLGAKRVGVFGSFAKGTANAESDVDVYLKFEEGKSTYDNLVDIGESLENAFGRRVDLITDGSLTENQTRIIEPTVKYAA